MLIEILEVEKSALEWKRELLKKWLRAVAEKTHALRSKDRKRSEDAKHELRVSFGRE